MSVRFLNVIIALGLLVAASFADFIQDPIPPSSRQNYFQDTDGNGRMDRMEILFLGVVSRGYIDALVDSLTFEWIDEDGVHEHFLIKSKDMSVDPKDTRKVFVDLASKQKKFRLLTGLSTMEYPASIYGSALLYLKDGSVFPVPMQDGMAPAISKVRLKSLHGKGKDTLTVRFAENISEPEGCLSLFEYKSLKDGKVHPLKSSTTSWNAWSNEVILSLEYSDMTDVPLTSRDSVRLVSGCLKDSSGNVVSNKTKFVAIKGFYPFEMYVPYMALDGDDSSESKPIFQLNFNPVTKNVNENFGWGVFMEALGPDFEKAIREKLNMKERTPINRSKIRIVMKVQIFTNLGAYVVGTQAVVRGDDARFAFEPTVMSLQWNFMDGHGRHVATGAYLANVVTLVEYDGKPVFRSDKDMGISSFAFGVVRR